MKYRSLLTLLLPLLLFPIQSAHAGNATWNLNPVTAEWNNTANWTPATIPTASDIATFGVSNTTEISTAGNAGAAGIIFNAGASAYTIGVDSPGLFTITAPGITNNSGVIQTFIAGADDSGVQGALLFHLTGTAGSMTVFVAEAGVAAGQAIGIIDMEDSATAGNGAFTNKGAVVSGAVGGLTQFFNSSSGGNGTFTCEGGGVTGAGGGLIQFLQDSRAGNAVLMALGGTNGGDGGEIDFLDSSTAATARIELFGNGLLDVERHQSMAVGSIEGDGLVALGSRQLSVGSNFLSTVFSGVVEDGTQSKRGSLVKIGSGTLTLGGANTYTGGTTLSGGALLISNTTGSGTGTAAVIVGIGTLGGSGIISGAVTVGAGAFVAPAIGSSTQVTLTLQSSLTLVEPMRLTPTPLKRTKTKRAPTL